MKLFLSLIGIPVRQLKTIIHTFDFLVDGYHLDIMDGIFVPSKSLPPNAYNTIKTYTQKQLWIHLMTTNPLNNLDLITYLDKTIVSFHVETKKKVAKTIFAIKESGGCPSLAINPETSIFDLEPYLDLIDHITLMSVKPGASGQKFIQKSVLKIEQTMQLCSKNHKQITLACDGGINPTNIPTIKEAGISEIAISNAVFQYKEITKQKKALEKIRALM